MLGRLRRKAPLFMVFALVACSGSGVTLETAIPKEAKAKKGKGLKYRDFDPVPIRGRQPKDFDIHGIDVSRYNKSIDWARAKANGVSFAFIKATEGRDNVDPNYAVRWREIEQAGIPRSAYHFYYFCAPPVPQAKNYMRNVPKADRALPPILDVEWNPKSPTCRKRPSPPQVRRVLKKWLDTIENHYGQKPIIYTTVDFFGENFKGGHLPGYQYWLRSVRAEPKLIVYGDRPWTFWQYTGSGKIPGIVGKVDINVFKGSDSQWREWLAANTRG